MQISNITSPQSFKGVILVNKRHCPKANVSFDDVITKAKGQVIESRNLPDYFWVRLDDAKYEKELTVKLKNAGILFMRVKGKVPYENFQTMAQNNF